MRTDLPPDIRDLIRPIPADFTAAITQSEDGKTLNWIASVVIGEHGRSVRVEYGLRLPPASVDRDVMASLIDSVRQTAWQTTELARLNRIDLITYLLADRHSSRPQRQPLSQDAQELLRNVQENHARNGN